jgi:hypothetical protein
LADHLEYFYNSRATPIAAQATTKDK